MKKLSIVFAAVMTAVTIWLLSACSADAMKNVSERRSAYFVSELGAPVVVTAVSGVRETPYELDGRAAELKPYTLITVVPKPFDVNALYTYKAITATGEYAGALTVHPFASSFSAEFDAETTAEFTVEVTCGGNTESYALKSLVTPDMLDFEQAVAAAKSELDPPEPFEIRARIIKNPLETTEPQICWHVSFYSPTGESCGVLLDAVTAKPLAVKRA